MLPQKISTFAEIYDSVQMRFPNDADGGGSYDERGRKEKVGKEEVRGREKGKKEGSWQHGLTRKEKKERKEREWKEWERRWK